MIIKDLCLNLSGKLLLDKISLSLPKGEISLILGPNGAGKTLLLRCLAGLLKPASGDVLLAGDRSILGMSATELAEQITWVPLSASLPFTFTVWDLLLMGRYRSHQGFPQERDRDIALHALERMQLMNFKNRIYNSLSRGEQTKVDIARAIATEAPILIFDEPFANLDIDACLHILGIFHQLRREGKSLILSHHDLYSVQDLATHVTLLKAGKLVAYGRTAEVFTVENIRRTYNVEARVLTEGQEAFIRFHLPS